VSGRTPYAPASLVTSYRARLGMLQLSHATLGWICWAPRATIWSNGYPILAMVGVTRKSGFAQEAAYLIALAQETFKRSSAIESCWPAVISMHKTFVYLISMSFTREHIRAFENTTTARVSCSRLVVQVHHRWKMGERDGRMSFVEDMAASLNRRPVVETDGKATSFMQDYNNF